MIPQDFIEEVKQRNPIEDVVSAYVSLKRAGSNMVGCCPFHSERTPSFTVFPSTQTCHCFGCGQGGDVVNFIRKIENLDYPAAVELLAKRAGLTMPVSAYQEKNGVDRHRFFKMNLIAAQYFREQLFSFAGQNAMTYLTDRGVSGAAIRHFGLGYSPDSFGALTDRLRAEGFTDEEMLTGFLCGKSRKTGKNYDYFRNRVMFPIIDVTKNIVAFGGRVMDHSEPKYLNSSDTPVFKKSRNLFALNFAKAHCADSMILCEGYMDVIALHSAGFENAVATLGTALTPEQARIMARYTKKVFISYDSDAAGRKATDRAMGILTEAGLEVRVLRYSGAKDPDEYIRKFGADGFRRVLDEGRTRFDYTMEDILGRYDVSLAEQRIRACTELCEVVSRVYSAAERDVYISQIAEKLGISKESIASDVSRQTKRRIRESKKNESRQLQRTAAGYGDRVNPEYARNVQAARAEETILGLLLIYPDQRAALVSGKIPLTADDFVTSFAKRVFEAILQGEKDGIFNESALGEQFTADEMSRIAGYRLARQSLTDNGESVLREACRTLCEEKQREKARSDGGDLAELQMILNKKRKKQD